MRQGLRIAPVVARVANAHAISLAALDSGGDGLSAQSHGTFHTLPAECKKLCEAPSLWTAATVLLLRPHVRYWP